LAYIDSLLQGKETYETVYYIFLLFHRWCFGCVRHAWLVWQMYVLDKRMPYENM